MLSDSVPLLYFDMIKIWTQSLLARLPEGGGAKALLRCIICGPFQQKEKANLFWTHRNGRIASAAPIPTTILDRTFPL